ncbi:MAG: transporter, family, methylenomycin resistance protein [Micromonosporaceae bacterium]|nr:transporter, family, methylenomycin resistance protein [Micromonosporaceae bacterium]
MVLDTTVVNVALPAIEHTPGGGVADAQWVVDAYTLTFGPLGLSGGHVSDRLGASVGPGIGAAGFSLSSTLCAMDRRPPPCRPLGGHEACECWPWPRA